MAVKFLNGIDVDGSMNIAASDVPNLDASKITSGTFSADRIPTGLYQPAGDYLDLETANTTFQPIGNYLTSVPSEYLTQTEGDARYLTSLPSHNHDTLYDPIGSANAVGQQVNERIDTEVFDAINSKQPAGNYFTDGDTVLNMANNDGLVYNDTNNTMYIKKDGTDYAIIDAGGGTITGTLTLSGGGTKISMNNGDITGVNQILINDPGEGIVWTNGSSGNMTLAIRDDASDNTLNLTGTGAALAINGLTVATQSWVSGQGYLTSLPSHNHDTLYDSLGSANAVNARIDNEVFPAINDLGNAIPTNNNQLTNGAGYATTSYVNTAVSNLVASAPATLDTLNELAAALGDDANFSTTVANNIGAIDTRINDEVIPYIDAVAGDAAKGVTAYSWGNHAGLYLGATAKAADSNLLDGINSTSFLRSDQADTMSGTLTITGSNGVSRLRIEGTTPTIDLDDADGDSFYIHVNSNNFYVLTDRDGGGDYGTWESPHPMQLEADTNSVYFFGNKLNSAAYAATTAFDSAGSAAAVSTALNERIDTEVFDAIGAVAGDAAKGVTAYGWGNHASAGYLTTETYTGTITGVSTGTGLDGTASSGAVTITLDLSELTDMTAAVDTAVDELILLDNGAERRKRFAEIFGSAAYSNTSAFDSAGSAAGVESALNARIDTEVFDAIGVVDAKAAKGETAYGWGNHASAGYLTSVPSSFTTTNITATGYIKGGGQQLVLSAGEAQNYATGQTAEYIYMNAEQGLEINSDTGNWAGGWAARKTAYLRGDQLTLDGETLTKTNIQNFKTAYGWGDHSAAGYLTSLPAHNHDGSYDPIGSADAVALQVNTRIDTEVFDAIATVDSNIPTNNNQLTNGAGYITAVPSSFSTNSITIGNGVTLSESTDRADLLMIKSSTSTWGGLQISNTSNEIIFSMMGDGNVIGLYDDLNNDWVIQRDENGSMRFYANASNTVTVTTTGLSVTGAITASGDVTAFSDARVKENVETLSNALESVKQMRGVTYNKIGEEKQSVGVIAQELEEVVPQLVHTDEEGMKSVAYGNITAVLIEALKEQQAQIEELKARLDGLTK